MKETPWERHKPMYGSLFKWDYKYRQNLIHLIMTYTSPDSSILDVGCLQGQYAKALRDNSYIGKYKGVDIASSFIEIAKTEHPKEAFEVGNIHSLQERDGSYDMVVCSHVVDHLHRLDLAVSNLFRISNSYVMLCSLYSEGDSKITTDHDLINHYHSLASLFECAPPAWKVIRSHVFHPEWDPEENIVQLVFKRLV